MSGCRVHDSLAPTAPNKEIEIIQGYREEGTWGDRKSIRRSPYPPNLRRTPAKIILPATGASTWALGSHKWVTYIGIFTRKARIQKAHQTCS